MLGEEIIRVDSQLSLTFEKGHSLSYSAAMVHRKIWQILSIILLSAGALKAHATNFSMYNSTFSLKVEKTTGGVFVCSSVAINTRTLLTAGHCLENAKEIVITDGKIERKAKSWAVHPEYNKMDSKYFADVGMIRLSRKLPMNLNYPKLSAPVPYFSLNRIGFGGREGKNVRTLVSGIWITEEVDATLVLKDELGVPGDSGGPLFQFINGELSLVAIHSTVEGKKSYAPVVKRLFISSY